MTQLRDRFAQPVQPVHVHLSENVPLQKESDSHSSLRGCQLRSLENRIIVMIVTLSVVDFLLWRDDVRGGFYSAQS